MRVALDTNVLAYAEGINGAERRDAAVDLVRKLPQEAGVVPIQVLGELFNVLVRKAGKSRSDARDALLSWRDTFSVVETSPEVMRARPISRRTINCAYGMQSSSRLPRKAHAVCFCRRTFRKVSPGPE